MKKQRLIIPALFVLSISLSACNFLPNVNRSQAVNSGNNQTNQQLNNGGDEPIVDEANRTVIFGIYPQTRVTNTSLISNLEKLQPTDVGGWYCFQGTYYAKVIGKLTNTQDSQQYWSREFDDGTEIIVGNTYWFRCDPIEWDIISGDFNHHAYILRSRYLLDTHIYDEDSNNYIDSDLRFWLNNEFFYSAFAFSNFSRIRASYVDNSASQTDSNSAELASEDTYDNVFVPSYAQLGGDNNSRNVSNTTNSDYLRYLTDYAFATGAYNTTRDNAGFYWTRSPSGSNNNDRTVQDAWYNMDGRNWYWDVNAEDIAVLPQITIDMA